MNNEVKNVLLVGNGFDIAHNLKTSYIDFLSLMKGWDGFYRKYKRHPLMDDASGIIEDDENCVIDDFSALDSNIIEKLNYIIQNNSWVKYYCKCGAEMDGWIDFEKEIDQVIDIFNALINGTYHKHALTKVVFDQYCSIVGANVVLADKYRVGRIRIKKKTLLNDLRKEFDEFIEALELYLYEFVYKNMNVTQLKQIKNINADYVISFNYTLTEKIYGIKDENVHHIHGKIREDSSVGTNNMVLGIDEREYDEKEFVYYMKYFQRIQKRTGIRYKKIINRRYVNSLGQSVRSPFELYIYGHSLDITDEDILKYVIGDKKNENEIALKPKKVIIFYYDQADYEQKVINLINLYGRTIIEKYIENGKFEFRETDNEVV